MTVPGAGAALHLEELPVGTWIDGGWVRVEAAEMTEFAARFTPHRVFVDPAAAEASLYGRLAASSLHLQALCLGRAVRAIAGVAVLCDLGFEAVTVGRPVHDGDRFRVRARWSSVVRPAPASRPGVATLDVRGTAPDGVTVVRFAARYLVARRPPADAP